MLGDQNQDYSFISWGEKWNCQDTKKKKEVEDEKGVENTKLDEQGGGMENVVEDTMDT